MTEEQSQSAEPDSRATERQSAPAPLVGRTPELRHLAASVERVRRGNSTVTTIEGEPGIGKTMLLAELRRRVLADGWFVLDCRCHALDMERPFVAVADALDELCETLGATAPSELSEAHSLLRQVSSGTADTVSRGRYITTLIVEGVHELADSAPVLVVFDDAHWIDEASASVLWGIVRRQRTSAVFTVATFRPAARDAVDAIRRGLDTNGAANLVLSPLASDDARELLHHILGRHARTTVATENFDALLRAASGNPLFITELARGRLDVIERGAINDANDADAVPPALRGLVLRRLRELPEEAQSALTDAALLGAEFDLHELADVSGMSFDDLTTVLQPAVDLRLVVDAGDRLAFQHAIVQTIISEQHPLAVQRERHHHIAERLGSRGSISTRIAEQYWRAGPRIESNGLRWLRQAANDVRSLSLSASLTWFERALVHATERADRFEVQCQIASLLLLIGRVNDSEALCLSMDLSGADPEEQIRVHTMLAIIATMAGGARGQEAAERVLKVESLLPERDSRLAVTLGWRASIRMFAGQLDEAEALARQAFTVEVDGPLASKLIRAEESLGLIMLLRGDVTEAQSHTAQALSLFAQYDEMFDATMMPHFAHAMALLPTNDAVDIIAVLREG